MPSTLWKDLVNGEDLQKAQSIRKKKKIIERVDLSKVDDYIKRGFEKENSSSKMAKMVYVKPKQDLFEDDVWLLLYKLGFTHMNANSYFGLPTKEDPNEPKQIDVFAYDGKVALVIECKRSEAEDDEEPKSNDFKKDLEEIRLNMEVQEEAIKKHFNDDNITVAFVFFTNKYKMSEGNRRTARNYGIAVLNEYDLDYYKTMYSRLQNYAKIQILSDIFGDKEIKTNECVVPAIKGNLSGNDFYTFMIHPNDLLQVSFIAHKKLNGPDDGAYQRIVNKKRLNDIRAFLQKDGFFANNIIINLNSDNLQFVPDGEQEGILKKGTLTIPGKYKGAYVIDGQHRLYGYIGTQQAFTEYIPVTAFHNLDTGMQSKIFVDINSNQKKVNSNLLIKVQSQSKLESTEVKDWIIPVAIKAMEDMSKDPKSPLYEKVKDEFDNNSKGDITLRAISSGFHRSNILGTNIYSSKTFIPGPLFADSDDPKTTTEKKIKTFINRAFSKIKNGCPNHWARTKDNGSYLTTPNGFEALLKVLYDLIQNSMNIIETTNMAAETIYSKIDRYVAVIGEAFDQMDDNEIDSYKKRSGYSGIDKSVNEIELKINEKIPSYEPQSLKDYKEKNDKKYTDYVFNELPLLEEKIVKQVKNYLVKRFGSKWFQEKEYKEIGKELNSIQFEQESEDPLESFIDLEYAYKIILASNWNLARRVFGVKNSEGKSKEHSTKWINELKQYKKSLNDYQKISSDEYEEFVKIQKILSTQFDVFNNADDPDDILESYLDDTTDKTDDIGDDEEE